MGDVIEFPRQAEVYWGGCPKCKEDKPHVNIGAEHWCYCEIHKFCWCIGENLFSPPPWPEDHEENRRFLLGYTVVEPCGPSKTAPRPAAQPQPDDDWECPF